MGRTATSRSRRRSPGAAASANAPPNIPFPGYFNVNSTQDLSISLTKVAGRHTFKTGFYNTHSYKAEQATGRATRSARSASQQDTVGTNPFDTSFGFANAAIGTLQLATARRRKYVEGNYVYDNIEVYVQDNWKVNSKLTLDYGVRFVHQTPQYDKLGQAANFLPDKWAIAQAPVALQAGLHDHGRPGHGVPDREPAGAESADRRVPRPELRRSRSRTLVPDTGSSTNGLFLGGQGIVGHDLHVPGARRRAALRHGVRPARGRRQLVLRGGGGIFYDRPFGNSVISMAGNPPTSKQVTARYSQLQSLGAAA